MGWKIPLSVLLLVVLLSACAGTPSSAVPTSAPGDGAEVTASPTLEATAVDLSSEAPPAGAEDMFATDFSRHTVSYAEIQSEYPLRGEGTVQPVDDPQMVSIDAAEDWIEENEPVIFVKVGDDARAYPVQILMWHDIANDTVGGLPVAVTFSSLTNSAVVFDRRVDDQTLEFAASGYLRFNNLIMFDRQTETWWQQATGEAVAGEYAGRQLALVPASVVAWSDFKAAYPEGQVLSRNTGFMRRYGQNPYGSYDDRDSPRFYEGPAAPADLAPLARVLALDLNGERVVYPYQALRADRVVNDMVSGEPVVVFWKSGVASPVNAGIVPEGRDVGTIVAFSRTLDGETLNFKEEDGRIVDEATGSVWNILGRATEGPLAGQHLEPIVGVNHFWFSWAAFHPETQARVYQQQTPAADVVSEATPVIDPSEVIADNLPFDFAVLAYQGEDALGGDALYFSDVLAQGKPVVVNFGAGLCPACRKELPEIQAAYDLYGDQVIFLFLDVGPFTGLGDGGDTLDLLAELGVTIPAASTRDPAVLQKYTIAGIPSTLYFTPDGDVFDRQGGLVGGEGFYRKIEALIAASGS